MTCSTCHPEYSSFPLLSSILPLKPLKASPSSSMSPLCKFRPSLLTGKLQQCPKKQIGLTAAYPSSIRLQQCTSDHVPLSLLSRLHSDTNSSMTLPYSPPKLSSQHSPPHPESMLCHSSVPFPGNTPFPPSGSFLSAHTPPYISS